MKAIYLIWHKFYANDGERAYRSKHPTWSKIVRAFERLDAQDHPSLCLYFHEDIKKYPQFLVIGGHEGYAVFLSCGDSDGHWTHKSLTLQYHTTDHQGNHTSYRAIGKGYHNYEIEEEYFSNDRGTILQLLQHIALTALWHPEIPYQIHTYRTTMR